MVQEMVVPMIGTPTQRNYGIGNRILPDRAVQQPLGGGTEAGYGLGNRVLPQIGTARHNNAHLSAVQGQASATRYHRHPGDFRQHTFAQCPQEPAERPPGQPVAWPKTSCATARLPARPRDQAPWEKSEPLTARRNGIQITRPAADTAGVFRGGELTEGGTSKQVPDWMQQWQVPTPPPYARQTGTEAARKFEGAAGKGSGVVLADNAITRTAPEWMHIREVDEYCETGGRGVEGNRQGGVVICLPAEAPKVTGWKTDHYQPGLESDAAGVQSGVVLGDSATSCDLPSWMRIAEVDGYYQVIVPPQHSWEPADNYAKAPAKVPSGDVPNWMEIGGVPRSGIPVTQPHLRIFPTAPSVKPWLQGARKPERRYSVENRGSAARAMQAAAPVDGDDEDEGNRRTIGHVTERLNTPAYKPADGQLPAWAKALKQDRRTAPATSRALPFVSCHGRHGHITSGLDYSVPVCTRQVQQR